MKILYCTDLHGDITKYEKVLEIAREKEIDTIINGGDILPKRGERYTVQAEFLKNYLPEYFERLKELGITYLVMLGNDDLYVYESYFKNLCNSYENVHNIDGECVKLGEFEVIGMNKILDTPFACKDWVVTEDNFVPDKQFNDYAMYSKPGGYEIFKGWELRQPKLPHMKDILSHLPEPEDSSKTIYVTHMPPAGLDLGHIYNSDRDVGSRDIYEFFREMQPLLTLHGHLHENALVGGRYVNSIGDTICFQPGQTEFGDPEMIYLIVDPEENTYERIVEKL